MQVQGLPGKPVLYRNARHCFFTILRQEGVRAFYRGLLSSFMKASSVLAFLSYTSHALLLADKMHV